MFVIPHRDIKRAEKEREEEYNYSVGEIVDRVGTKREDAIHLQPYKKPALLPGKHEHRERRGLLTLSHVILSQMLRVPTRQLEFREWTRRDSLPPAASCVPGIRKLRLECTWSPFWNLGRFILTKTRWWSALVVTVVDTPPSVSGCGFPRSDFTYRSLYTYISAKLLILILRFF